MKAITYAHRGASAYFPENTMMSFYQGYLMGADGIETDVQQTKDGVLVLTHDTNLMRVAGREDKIAELTYEELKKVDVGIWMGEKFKGERIPTLEEFLKQFTGKGLHLAIEIKQVGIENDLMDALDRYDYYDHIIITSFQWDALKAVRALRPEVRTGYLAHDESDELLAQMLDAGIWQYCPRASTFTPEWNEKIRKKGFSIRAWGVKDEELMNKMLDFSVDGMTVNFPDKMLAELKRRNA